MRWPFRRATKKVAVVPPPANGAGEKRSSLTTGEWDAIVAAEREGDAERMEKHLRACDAAVSGARRRSSGFVTAKP